MDAAYSIPANDADLYYIPHFLSESEHTTLLQQWLTASHWRQDKIKLFGRSHNLPRLQAWYGDEGCSYSYSGIKLPPTPWTENLMQLKQRLETFCQSDFNAVLLNLYRNGQDSNGWHADDEPELGDHPVIASISLGATRRFRLRHKHQKAIPAISLDLEAGSLLVMKGETQQNWQHCIPKTSRSVTPRINLTFRKITHGQS